MKKITLAKATAMLFLTCLFVANTKPASAAMTGHETENSLAGMSVVMNNYYIERFSEQGLSIENAVTPIYVNGMRLEAVNTNILQFNNLAVCSANDYIVIREKATSESNALGKLYSKSAATILEQGKEWTKIKSGNVTGYVKSEYLSEKDEAIQVISTTYKRFAYATCQTLNIRSGAGTEYSIIGRIAQGESLEIVSASEDWLEVLYEGQPGFVSKDYVDTKYKLKYAISAEEEAKIAAANAYDINHMVWPLPADHRIYSYFGKRVAPTKGASTYHQGLDIGGATGSKIVSVLSGTVRVASYSKSRGYYVEVEHGNGVVSRYQHCSKLLVSAGQKVTRGDAIALVGSTGVSTAPHLHFSLIFNGTNVDPYPYLKSVQ